MKIKNLLRAVLTLDGYCMLYNIIKLKLLGVKCAKKTFIHGHLFVKSKGEIVLGNYFTYSSGNAYNPLDRNIRGCLAAYGGGKIYIGEHVSISSGCIWARGLIKIGNNCMIGSNVIITDSDSHSLNYKERRNDGGNIRVKPIYIGDDVWIGMNVIILKGVRIGNRSIIGAGSVVTKNIPEDEIWAGNPAKFLRKIKES